MLHILCVIHSSTGDTIYCVQRTRVLGYERPIRPLTVTIPSGALLQSIIGIDYNYHCVNTRLSCF